MMAVLCLSLYKATGSNVWKGEVQAGNIGKKFGVKRLIYNEHEDK